MGIVILFWMFFGCVLDGFSDYNCYTHNQRVTQKFRNVYDFFIYKKVVSCSLEYKLQACKVESPLFIIFSWKMRNRMRKIVAATEENKEEILKLYKIQLGREFCPWDDSYPGMKEIEFDLGRESLFVMIDGQEINADAVRKEDRIIAAISIDDDPQVERLDCWSHKLAPGAELSRLAVHPDFQNQKIARQMLVFGMEELARREYKSVHFLVNKLNVKALRSYAVFGFDTVGECSLFGQPFLCYEKSL